MYYNLVNLPINISKAEMYEFSVWLKECCSMDIDKMSVDEIICSFRKWEDECYQLIYCNT